MGTGRFEVAIAGAGLAGASLALRLARRGVRVALLDPGRFPRDKVCGEFLSPECWGVLDRLGLTGEVEGSGYHPIRLVRLSTPSGREVTAEVLGPDGRPGIGLSRSFLDDLIVRRPARPGPRSSRRPGSAGRSSKAGGWSGSRPEGPTPGPSRSGPRSPSPPTAGIPRWSSRRDGPGPGAGRGPGSLA